MGTKKTFSKPPLTLSEKEKLANQFIEGANKKLDIEVPVKTKTLFLRAPESYYDDIHKIMKLTGLSMNAICLELLRPAIKQKLKEIKEE
jgi:hypothetical protein